MDSTLLLHFSVCTVLALISIPLILKRVPPNRLYGVRTAKTLSDSTTWYKVNRFGGWAILISSIIGAVTIALVAQYMPMWSGHAGLLMLVPLIVALAAIWLYTMRIADVPPQ